MKVLCPESRQTDDTLCLLVHTRGIVQDAYILEDINETVVFDRDFFPSGVSNLLLLTKNRLPLSERLVFVHNKDQANIESVTANGEIWQTKHMVDYSVSITDEAGVPLSGNISVSITDDCEIAVDTTSNILTSLLLSSDLRGNITDPAFFFRKDTQSEWAADLLMLTQGWRRYDTERIVKNDFIYPDTLFEKGFEISGTVKSYLLNRPEENANVNFISLSGGYFGYTTTDRYGRFYLHDGDAPDSTRFIVRTAPQSGNRRLELTLDKASWPARTIPSFTLVAPEQDMFLKYAEKAGNQYINEHGTRIIQLGEVAVTAQKKPQRRSSSYYSNPDRSLTESEIDRIPTYSMNALLSRMGVRIDLDGDLFISQFGYEQCPAKILVDDVPTKSIDWLEVTDIAQVDLLTSPINLVSFGGGAACGAIAIYTRDGTSSALRRNPNINSIVPLGFQKPVEFYAPPYDSPYQNTMPDLRTTIYWQPNLTADESGTASFSFYTADTPSTYSVVIEGVTWDGKIIYKRDKIAVRSVMEKELSNF